MKATSIPDEENDGQVIMAHKAYSSVKKGAERIRRFDPVEEMVAFEPKVDSITPSFKCCKECLAPTTILNLQPPVKLGLKNLRFLVSRESDFT